MSAVERDLSIIRHIADYCSQIFLAVNRFGNNFETFDSDPVYRNSVALCILQIGELVGLLSEQFREEHTDFLGAR